MIQIFKNLFPAVISLILLTGPGLVRLIAQTTKPSTTMETFSVKTPAFVPNGTIPSKFTCDGENISPSLDWAEVPEGTNSIVLIMDDPDAPNGDWVHFILFNIPPETRHLAENFKVSNKPGSGMKAGSNSSGKLDYHGPCPPSGTHRYFFKLYALDILITEPEGITKMELLKAMEGHVLAKGQIIGLYQRKNR